MTDYSPPDLEARLIAIEYVLMQLLASSYHRAGLRPENADTIAADAIQVLRQQAYPGQRDPPLPTSSPLLLKSVSPFCCAAPERCWRRYKAEGPKSVLLGRGHGFLNSR